MKFLPPIVTLALVAGWLGIRHQSLTTVRENVTILEKRIEQARSATASPADDRSLASRLREERGALFKPGEPIDWKRVADRFAASPEENLAMRDFAALQQRVMEMSPAELVEALDEIDALGLPESTDRQLEGMLLGQLARKDPQQALEKFGDRIGSAKGQFSWQLTEAIRGWTDDDPAAAQKWFDRKIAEGLFDSTSLSGRNQDRIRFEAAMIGALLPGNTSDAVRRLAELPESQRAEILRQHWFLQLKPGDHEAFATLARQSLPAPRHVLADAARNLVHGDGGYQRVDDYLLAIQPSDEERLTIASLVAQNKMVEAHGRDELRAESIGEVHDWLARHVPGEADATIGTGLAQLGGDVEQNAKLVSAVHAETGSDAILVAFLKTNAATAAPDTYLPLIDKISDPQTRAELQEHFEMAKDSIRSIDPGDPR